MRKVYTVLLLVENLSVPADPRVWREAKALHQAGFHVCIISPKGNERDGESYIYKDGIHIYRYELPPTSANPSGYTKEYLLALFHTFRLSLRIWLKHDIDVIHAANPPDLFFLIGLFYRLFGKKFLYDQHDLAPEILRIKFPGRLRLLQKVLLWLERCSYRAAHMVITSNESQRYMALKRGKRAAKDVFVVRNGPELSRYVRGETEQELKRGRNFLLLYIGVMGRQDGIEYALQALHELVHVHQRQDVGIALLGDGECFAELQTLAQQLQLEPYVHFAGWVEQAELLRYLNSAAIGLCPDPSNELNDRSTMLKTMEYMAMGLPVVAFDLPETRYSAQDAALYAKPNNVTDFARQIERLLDDSALRARMGTTGRARVEQTLCWEKSSETLHHVYAQLLS